MTVTCPNCETQFNLDDKQYAPGRRARCSVCSFVFTLPAPLADNNAPGEKDDALAPQGAPVPEFGKADDKGATQKAPSPDSLPDELEGARLDKSGGYGSSDMGAMPGQQKKKGGCLKRLVFVTGFLLCLSGLGAAAYVFYFEGKIELPFKLPFNLPGGLTDGAAGSVDPVAKRISDLDKVKDMLLLDVSHKYVNNANLGPLVVITGKVKNNFSVPKEMIRVEASLLDKKGKILATQQQYCGIVVPDLQLQVLGQRELAQALDNRFDMLANNINVQPGVEVAFMVVFVYPPSNMSEYTVVVADVSDPPNLTP